jgi:hypothetical protein
MGDPLVLFKHGVLIVLVAAVYFLPSIIARVKGLRPSTLKRSRAGRTTTTHGPVQLIEVLLGQIEPVVTRVRGKE